MASNHPRPATERRLSSESTPCRAARPTVQVLPRIGVNAREVLNRRQDQLHDTPLMRPVLTAALQQLIGEPVSVEAYEVHFCKLEPWVFLDTALTLTLRCPRTR